MTQTDIYISYLILIAKKCRMYGPIKDIFDFWIGNKCILDQRIKSWSPPLRLTLDKFRGVQIHSGTPLEWNYYPCLLSGRKFPYVRSKRCTFTFRFGCWGGCWNILPEHDVTKNKTKQQQALWCLALFFCVCLFHLACIVSRSTQGFSDPFTLLNFWSFNSSFL